MTKRKSVSDQPEEAVDMTVGPDMPVEETGQSDGDPLVAPVADWLTGMMQNPMPSVERIVAGLHHAGIHTPNHLAAANVNLVRRVLMSALQADAHSLTGAAVPYREE